VSGSLARTVEHPVAGEATAPNATDERRRMLMRRQQWYRALMWVGLGYLVLLAGLGAWFGWWSDWGTVLGMIGLALTVVYGAYGASEQALEMLRLDVGDVSTRLDTTNVILGRIETLLGTRLPPPA
jgi:hypothetical protein